MSDTTKPDTSDLAKYVEASESVDSEFLTACLTEASGLVGAHLETGAFREVPPSVRDRAALEVAADLFYRRATRLGISGFNDADLNPVRITRDPMAAARDLIAPYMKGPFA